MVWLMPYSKYLTRILLSGSATTQPASPKRAPSARNTRKIRPEDAPVESRRRYFEETGFWVTGNFLDYFEANGEL